MSIWMIWLAVAGILVAIEIFSGTFYLLMIAIGLAAGGLAAMAGAHVSVQFIVAAHSAKKQAVQKTPSAAQSGCLSGYRADS